MGWLEGVLSLDGTLDGKVRKKRTLFLLFMCVVAAFSGVGLLSYSSQGVSERVVAVLSLLVMFVISLFAIVWMLCRRPLVQGLVHVSGGVFAVSILFHDLSARSASDTSWPLLVLVVDFLLVMQANERFVSVLVAVTLCYLLLIAFESTLRFGMLDLPGLVPQEGERGRRETVLLLSDCTSLPCALPVEMTMRYFLAAASVFVLDFIATRGFARDVLKEQTSMERTINAVQEIASLLAGYDVEQVAELLATHEHELPAGMTKALRRLEQNLRVYKAYLPATCLQEEGNKYTACSHDSVSSTMEGRHTSTHSSKQSTVPKQEAVVRALGLAPATATLLTVNIKDTLRIVEDDSARFSELFTEVLLNALGATAARHGMVDVFVGDRIHCSFNVSRRCANHATSALHAATMLFRTSSNDLSAHFNIGIATGKVLRGDMGCEVMRRFSMVGALVRDVHLIERAGRVFGCDVLCNRICFTETECEHNLRLIPCRVEVSRGCETEVVAELVVSDDDGDSTDNEWMYVIGDERRWDAYNTAVRGYLVGTVAATEVAAQALKADCDSNSVTVVPGARLVLNLPVYDDL